MMEGGTWPALRRGSLWNRKSAERILLMTERTKRFPRSSVFDDDFAHRRVFVTWSARRLRISSLCGLVSPLPARLLPAPAVFAPSLCLFPSQRTTLIITGHIPEKHFQTFFGIFRRLHGQDKYGGGTGSSLNHCPAGDRATWRADHARIGAGQRQQPFILPYPPEHDDVFFR